MAGTASAVIFQLPPGSPPGAQVNNDAGNGIDPAKNAGLSDVVGGSLAAGGINVPWAAFEQQRSTSPGQEIFVRSFKGGAWTTQGQSLNIVPAKEAEAPSIDFAGAGRTVPWVAWYEPSDALGGTRNIFASRFCTAKTAVCPTANTWFPEGQARGSGATKPPSLNINTDRSAEDPAVAGGATVAGNDPVPWVAWEENDGKFNGGPSTRQIFVSKAVKNAALNSACPAGTKPTGGNSVGLFCWQQVGRPRLNKNDSFNNPKDPTLNIDPSRAGIEPDDAFTGPNDTVLWVVWYELGDSKIGLANNERVFAAKIVANPNAQGGFEWHAVGNGTAGLTRILDNSGANHFGPCAVSVAEENKCTLNKVAGNDAEDPRVATGTLTPGGPTVPWVVWSEDTGGGKHGIFVSRLVGGDHFELFNGGNPVSAAGVDATTPDITFSGNTPYISWIQGGKVFQGHFEGTTFKLDSAGGAPTTGSVIDFRSPISSGCTANPFTSDGSACPGGAAGTPFNLFTTAGAPQKLFATSLLPSALSAQPATGVTSTGATLHGQVKPGGAVTKVHFDFGTTTAYGSSTPDQRIGPATTLTPFSRAIGGLTPNTTYHFRAVASSDFKTLTGADATFKTAP